MLDSAARAFALHGFAGASLEEIAESAGYSRGALYANFDGKDELLLTLVERSMQSQAAEAMELTSQPLSPADAFVRLRKSFATFGNSDREACLVIAEAQLYAIRNSRFRERLAALFRAQHQQIVALVTRFFEQLPQRARISPRQAAFIAVASLQGLTLRNLADPETFSDQMVEDALGWIFGALTRDTEGE
ncbi:MAG TPA: helix-turn-helix domain-containing protein [Acidobacteriaceae bacterium]